MRNLLTGIGDHSLRISDLGPRLSGPGILTLLDQGIFSLGSFFTSVIIGRYCAKEELGLFLLGFTIVYLLMDMQASFITTPYTILYPRLSEINRARFTGSTLMLQAGIALLISLLIALFSVIVPENSLPDGLSPLLLALAAITCFLLLREYTRRMFFARLQMKSVLSMDLTITLLQVLALLALLYFGLLSASTAILVIGAISGTGALLWLAGQHHKMQFNIRELRSHWGQCYQAGKWVFASGLLWNISVYLYPWILTHYHRTEAAGIWAACAGIVALCHPLYLGLQNYFTPSIAHAFARQGKSGLRRYTFKSTAIFAGLLAVCCVLLVLFGGILLVWFYGDKYAGHQNIISLLAVNLLFLAAGFSFSRAFFTLDRAEVDFKINIFGLLILFTLGVWAIRNFGVPGAALGLMIGNGVALILRAVFFRKLARENSPQR